jgi:hypothetical protein
VVAPVSYFVASEQTSPMFAYAFAKGCGGTMTNNLERLYAGPMAAFGSPPVWPLLRKAKAVGREFYYADHGYMGRGKYYRVTRNAYQHTGLGPGSEGRFLAMHRTIQPWRKHGTHILVCPNSNVYFHLHGIDGAQWLRTTVQTLRTHTNRQIRVRWKNQARFNPIQRDLAGAWAVVVFSSAAAIDALIAGVPCVTLAPFAATARMGITDLAQIETPIYPPDREPFLQTLAANQFTIPEMLDGRCWRHLQEMAG